MKVWVCWLLVSGITWAGEINRETYRREAWHEINAARNEQGLQPLALDPEVTAISQAWADHLAQEKKLIHRSQTELFALIRRYQWRGVSENLHASPEAIEPKKCIASWMASRVHRRNLLNSMSRKAGLGVAFLPDGTVYVVFNGAG